MTTIGRQHPDEPHGTHLTPEERQDVAEHCRRVDTMLREAITRWRFDGCGREHTYRDGCEHAEELSRP